MKALAFRIEHYKDGIGASAQGRMDVVFDTEVPPGVERSLEVAASFRVDREIAYIEPAVETPVMEPAADEDRDCPLFTKSFDDRNDHLLSHASGPSIAKRSPG